ncbi:thioesterase family protein [Nocardioides sp. ChNu-153]|uniref:thioesterase family protein n=1 Tax=unclassified Nocardioides TaxID=2615069 RepID=UPI002406BE40|nr:MULTISPECIES: thioesterase family protein [unclassified Nocardioides]MDF9716440.1 thioesterase family protein [Nocardioides sp. ChNu-99]MDN7122831.1 thioesterase family protein [Nocardioides sp. ChNu-153]
MSDAYYERTGPGRFRATEHTGGAWDTTAQHVAPALGLLVHAIELDRDARRDDALLTARISADVLGTMPLGEVEVEVEVLRPGRTIELVQATMCAGGRAAVTLRAWLLEERTTATVAASALPRIAGPEDVPAWDPTTVWPGGFIASVDVRRRQIEPGRASFWARPAVPLVADEPVSPTARAAGLLDISNGMTVRVDPRRVAFPNVDLTAHLLRAPTGDWLGFDTTVSFGPQGLGVTTSVLHDATGPVGTSNQLLTVRPG